MLAALPTHNAAALEALGTQDASRQWHIGQRSGVEMLDPTGNSCRQQRRTRNMTSHLDAPIRGQEIEAIKDHLLPNVILEVCGPPMVGKTTMVKKAVEEKRHEIMSRTRNLGGLMHHDFTCKNMTSFQAVLEAMVQQLGQGQSIPSTAGTDWVFGVFSSVLGQLSEFQHVMVFNKCKSLRSSGQDHQFLDFLLRIMNRLSPTVQLSIVFTSYKQFPISGLDIERLEIDVLSVTDIVSILQLYVPDVNVDMVSYANVCQRTLPLPDAVRRVAEEFIADEEFRESPEELERIVNEDGEFLSLVLGDRLQEVNQWVPDAWLMKIAPFSHTLKTTFIEAHLELLSTEHSRSDWKKLLKFIKKNYVVRVLPRIKRLAVHPLVVYYCMTSYRHNRLALCQPEYDKSRNRYTNFLCRILKQTEMNIRLHGKEGLVFGCLAQEWPNIKNMLQMALQCNENTYEGIFKAGISANGIISRCFPEEAKCFYRALYEIALSRGSQLECDVLQAFLGHSLTIGSNITKEEWKEAEQRLKAATKSLSQRGPSFYLMWALIRTAITAFRQFKYKEAKNYFRQVNAVSTRINRQCLGETLAVSELQVEEERITKEVYEASNMVFTGEITPARQILDRLYGHIDDRCENHPDRHVLLNTIGLTEERGAYDLETAVKWYRKAYREKLLLEKICPQILVPSLNNIGMILYRQGQLDECLKFLHKALDIRRKCGWLDFFTALTLIHLGEVAMKCGDILAAFKNTLEADIILRKTSASPDTRLRANNQLAHLSIAIRQLLETDDTTDNQGNILSTCFSDLNHDEPRDERLEHEGPYRTADVATTGKNKAKTHAKVLKAMEALDLELIDLENSADDYFERTFQINSQMERAPSNERHFHVLLARAHSMLLHRDMSPEEFDRHRNAFLEYIQRHPSIEKIFRSKEAADSSFRNLAHHKDLYIYILSSNVLDPKEFLIHLTKACESCECISSFYDQFMWEKEIVYLSRKRKKDEDFRQDLERLKESTDDNGRSDIGRDDNRWNYTKGDDTRKDDTYRKTLADE